MVKGLFHCPAQKMPKWNDEKTRVGDTRGGFITSPCPVPRSEAQRLGSPYSWRGALTEDTHTRTPMHTHSPKENTAMPGNPPQTHVPSQETALSVGVAAQARFLLVQLLPF